MLPRVTTLVVRQLDCEICLHLRDLKRIKSKDPFFVSGYCCEAVAVAQSSREGQADLSDSWAPGNAAGGTAPGFHNFIRPMNGWLWGCPFSGSQLEFDKVSLADS